MPTTLLQLDPPIPVMARQGADWKKAIAHVLINHSIEHDLQWVVFIDATGESWTLRNQDIRAQQNITIGRHIRQD